MKKQKPRTWRWVSRNLWGYLIEVWPQFQRPEWSAKNGCFNQKRLFPCGVCPEEFKSLFGVCPAPGECVKVEFQKAKVIR